AEHPGGLWIPRQLAERLDIRDPDELPRLGPVADVLAVAVGEQVGGGPVDELEAPFGDPLPVVGGHALAHDAAGDRNELVVDITDALGVDLRPYTLNRLCATVGAGKPFEVCAHGTSWRGTVVPARSRRAALTVGQLAELTGLSKGMLSKIENAQASPSLATLARLSEALKVPVTAFFRGLNEEQDVLFVKAGRGLDIQHKGAGPGHRYQ